VISLPELLRRFRRVWVPPGAALARVAPPVDVSTRLRNELQPVLQAIEEMQQRAAAISTAAQTKATDVIEAANRQAAEKMRQAQDEAPKAREAAAEQQWHAVEGEITTALKTAQTEVARIEAVSRERLPGLVDKVRTSALTGDVMS
jgi:flagellar biosynthesis/type III secretory pathway protein FliH